MTCASPGCIHPPRYVVLDSHALPRAVCSQHRVAVWFRGEPVTVEQCDEGLLRSWREAEREYAGKRRKVLRETETALDASRERLAQVEERLQALGPQKRLEIG